MYLLIVDDFILHYDSVWSVGSLPGQCDAVFTLPLFQDHIHCKQSERMRERRVMMTYRNCKMVCH